MNPSDHTPPFLSRVVELIEKQIPDNHGFLVLIAPANSIKIQCWVKDNNVTVKSNLHDDSVWLSSGHRVAHFVEFIQ